MQENMNFLSKKKKIYRHILVQQHTYVHMTLKGMNVNFINLQKMKTTYSYTYISILKIYKNKCSCEKNPYKLKIYFLKETSTTGNEYKDKQVKQNKIYKKI